MRRVTAILLTSWVLVIGPALCQAGLFEHTCACPECRNECSEQQCPTGHACQDDPCGTRVIRQRPVETDDELAFLPLSADSAVLSVDRVDLFTCEERFEAAAESGSFAAEIPIQQHQPLLV